jgi:hypothetical protein
LNGFTLTVSTRGTNNAFIIVWWITLDRVVKVGGCKVASEKSRKKKTRQ